MKKNWADVLGFDGICHAVVLGRWFDVGLAISSTAY